MNRILNLVVIALSLAGCGDGQSYIHVTVTGSVTGIDHFDVIATNAGKHAALPVYSSDKSPFNLPFDFALTFDSSRSGEVDLTVHAMSADHLLAIGMGSAVITPSHGTDVTISLSPPDAGADLLASDQSPGDLAMTDFVVPDLAMPDFATPDFAMPDFAVPDFAHPDFAMPDLAQPDLSLPDLSLPDFSLPDFSLPDLSLPDFSQPDLVPPPPVMLLGVNQLLGGPDTHSGGTAGVADASNYICTKSGTVSHIAVYLSNGTTAQSLQVALYSDNGAAPYNNQPLSRLAVGTINNPIVGGWNTVAVNPPQPVTIGTYYWIALLGLNQGAFAFPYGSGAGIPITSVHSGPAGNPSHLISLPDTWVAGDEFPTTFCSFYATN